MDAVRQFSEVVGDNNAFSLDVLLFLVEEGTNILLDWIAFKQSGLSAGVIVHHYHLSLHGCGLVDVGNEVALADSLNNDSSWDLTDVDGELLLQVSSSSRNGLNGGLCALDF